MKILLAPNNFKGSLTAGQFCKTAKQVLRGAIALPVSDGGDGILEVFASAYPKAKQYTIPVLNAVYQTRNAPYLILPDKKTCIIETAKICGLGGLTKRELMPLQATSYGVGQVIAAAMQRGAKTFYIGLGGVACNDGGAGMAAALGVRFLDDKDRFIFLGASPLLKLKKIVRPVNFLKGIKFIGLSDVDNPLLGASGSAKIYGPQKGAGKSQVAVLEKALTNYARVVKKDLKININKPRCGAAGAIAAGIYGLLNGRLTSGADFILKQIKAEAQIKKTDLIITGEGRLDAQTFYGKAPAAICNLAKKYKKPVVFICGQNKLKNAAQLKKYNIKQVMQLTDYAPNTDEAIKYPSKFLKRAINAGLKKI